MISEKYLNIENTRDFVHKSYEREITARDVDFSTYCTLCFVCHTFGNISVLPEVRKYFRTTNVAGLLPEVMGLYGSASLLPDLLTVLQSF